MEEFKEKFDRVISIEMFEHMKNYEALLRKISTWLKVEGKLFVHIFTHKWKPYHFKDDWMARNFFTGKNVNSFLLCSKCLGGTMPSHSLLLNFQSDLKISDHWGISGSHYEKTLNIWLEKMDQNKDINLPIFKATYGDKVTFSKKYFCNYVNYFSGRDGGLTGDSSTLSVLKHLELEMGRSGECLIIFLLENNI